MKNPINNDYDVIIAGAGPAGLTASIYAVRSGMKAVVLEKELPGGKVGKTGEIENYPGFDKIEGPELAFKFVDQAIKLGANIEYSGLKSYKKEGNSFIVQLTNGKTITGTTLILATGTKERLLNVPGEKELYGKGVSYCAVCDGANFKNEVVAVVGGGYSAVEESIFLSRLVSKVHLIHRSQKFRVDQKLLDKLKANEKVELHLDSVVKSINGQNSVEGVTIQSLLDNSEKSIGIKAIFPFIGQNPVTEFIEQTTILDENKHIVGDENMKTTIEGLFVAGDVRRSPLKQIATAVSDGALAGQNAVKYIENLD
ncbi:thioredoxin-disulfide reductase [Spiroplasma tabanidicola]|uniref:Thioredoxin reductase n=1 Tax=Spiroplasma tabanidicola TaxID=324079 RepID=A0A6I6C5V4_9MOLU|nr:thioredoxin-disulfide reductase [Spiroplasma tabanidicola]QGS51520.1 thioredoxin reductase [Spiroplasma tabanidicola]